MGWIVAAVAVILLIGAVWGILWFVAGLMPSGGQWHGGLPAPQMSGWIIVGFVVVALGGVFLFAVLK